MYISDISTFGSDVKNTHLCTDDLRVNFSRTPVDECNLQCTGCSAVIQPWPRPVLEHTTTINARIGQSGSEKGYAGITGNVLYASSLGFKGFKIVCEILQAIVWLINTCT